MEKIEDDLTCKIIGCAMKVHAYLGIGFQEVIYQRALAIENCLNLDWLDLRINGLRHGKD